ncbi:ArsR family transcriptional regulator [bacterium]|jgi:ArsR family transcriptional regulator|nr:metalloregulator ArsR/SmtB family transcription factor [Patescibacteria group bacterium]MDD3777825.1 metalloregulator ArsR/SmtB family transcription factor [Patescibacteria group bacterium]MDD3939689.1 metalloregulator ArsR/SmtB family transcription factor [Patescibacteria group bacterium]MDD4443571.1 metalloregulator ArsR/SmtB family transcription factor [Patescibacteria group bacterium]NCD01275.1 ArsR family transcriptional regulator [bacterium]
MSLSQILNALADKNRQKIIQLLKRSELNVGEISKNLDITLATLSHHLDVLKKIGLISSRRQGKNIFYSLNLSVSEELLIAITKLIKK